MKTVIQSINAEIWRDLESDLAEIEADSVVGAAVVTLLNRVELAIGTTASDGGCLENDIRADFIDLALRQANVWYFG